MSTLFIIIPCYEEETLIASTLQEIPVNIEGISDIVTLVIDDGSVDNSLEIVKTFINPNNIIKNHHQGLAKTFQCGVDEALSRGADIIVNYDADGQYKGKDIPQLIAPIQSGDAEITLGLRQNYYGIVPLNNRLFHWLGCRIVSLLSGHPLTDAPSGFRAFTRRSASTIEISSEFSYTMELFFWASHQKLTFQEVPINVTQTARKSRLAKSIYHYVFLSAKDILNAFLRYRLKF